MKTENLFKQTIQLLNQKDIKFEFTKFNTAIMLDIWLQDKFYVIQFEDYVGISEINDENIGFDTTPDEKFYNEIDYMNRINKILNSYLK